jgi:hypothetical protein
MADPLEPAVKRGATFRLAFAVFPTLFLPKLPPAVLMVQATEDGH